MSDALTDLRLVNAVRRRSFVLPREHGAWGILLVPLFAGATIGLLGGGDPVPFGGIPVGCYLAVLPPHPG